MVNYSKAGDKLSSFLYAEGVNETAYGEAYVPDVDTCAEGFEGAVYLHPPKFVVNARPFTDGGFANEGLYTDSAVRAGMLANRHGNILGHIHNEYGLGVDLSDHLGEVAVPAGDDTNTAEGALELGSRFTTYKFSANNGQFNDIKLDSNGAIDTSFNLSTASAAMTGGNNTVSLTRAVSNHNGILGDVGGATDAASAQAGAGSDNTILYPWIRHPKRINGAGSYYYLQKFNVTLPAINSHYFVSATETDAAGNSYYLDLWKGNPGKNHKAAYRTYGVNKADDFHVELILLIDECLGEEQRMIYSCLLYPSPVTDMIVLDVKFHLKDGCFDQAVEAMKEVASETLQENGCAEYRFALPMNEGEPIVLFEEWESQDALNAHFETSHLAAFRAKMEEVLAEPPVIRRYVVSEAGPL